jgi:hypothetical protein
MTDLGMGEFARQDLRSLLASEFGISSASRAVDTDPSEEVILLSAEDFARVDSAAVALAVMRILPHVKVWVIKAQPAWDSEPL